MPEQSFLSHVLWLGGSRGAGKAAAAELLHEWHGLQLYNLAEYELAHLSRANQAKPSLWAAKTASLTPQQRWLETPPDAAARTAAESASERFEYICEDLLALPASPAIVAHGADLIPDMLLMVLDDPEQAVFLIPTDDYVAENVRRLELPVDQAETSHPEQAVLNLIEQELTLADALRDRAEALGLTIIDIDGSLSSNLIASELEEQWARWLHR